MESRVNPGGGGGTPILEHGEELPLYWPPFLTFSDPIGSFFMPNSILLTPSFCRKIGLCQSHLVPEIIWPKVGLIIHKNLFYFEVFCTNFLLDFRSCWPPFLQFLDLFDPSFLQNLRSCWVHFSSRAWPPYQGSISHFLQVLSAILTHMGYPMNQSQASNFHYGNVCLCINSPLWHHTCVWCHTLTSCYEHIIMSFTHINI